MTGRARDRATPAFVVAVLALTIGLFDPVVSLPQDVHRHLLVFDITQSMMVVDEGLGPSAPTRLEVAKRAAIEAMADMPCDTEIGVALFTGHRTLVLFSPVELCEHYDDISTTIDAIDWRMAWEARSEVAKGVHSALIAAKEIGRDTSVIFITDGHEAPPISAELPPRFRGSVGEVRGALAGIGGDELAPIPKLDSEGRRRGVWKHDEVLQVDTASLGRSGSSVSLETLSETDQIALRRRIAAGREHLSSLKEQYLREIAQGLSLHYARIRHAADMRAILSHSDLTHRQSATLALRHPLAALALALLAAIYLRGARWRRRQRAPAALKPRDLPAIYRN